MWDYPKSPRHQAAIDKMKAEHPREAARPARVKERREMDPTTPVIKEQEAARVLATRAKTARLRAARLAGTDEPAKKSKRR
jgi:hypothetical protein